MSEHGHPSHSKMRWCAANPTFTVIYSVFTASHVHLRTYARMSMRARTYYDCTETKKVFIRTP